MNTMNSCVDDIQDFFKINVHVMTENKKGK